MSLRALRELPNGMLGSFRNGRTVERSLLGNTIMVSAWQATGHFPNQIGAILVLLWSSIHTDLLKGFTWRRLAALFCTTQSRVGSYNGVWRSAG